jgi:indole-3-glycerol phosphate synthase
MSILQEILRYKREELKQRKNLTPLNELKTKVKDIETVRPFKRAIKREQNKPIKLIAELKKASPSEGRIREDFNIPEIISIYDRKDVDAISILTEEHFFEGKLDYLNNIRQTTEKPLLRKDFIFDNYQVYETKINGADAILLIVAVLDKSQLSDLLGLSKELSLECLVEVHNLKELDTALYSGADIIGINNRNLNTLQTSLNTTFDLMKDIPDSKVVVSESGINTRDDVKAIESIRVDAILVGTTFMKAKDIGAKIDELMGGKC